MDREPVGAEQGQKWVFAALQYALGRFPFPVLGIDSDNGSEFINDYLFCLLPCAADRVHPVPAREQE
ncbi:hypothetical protein [Arthrobacter globiformis]|uniref:hypothetical protein n=1 Tax=Arthrobacter globiformis TaxID=1665 RepID=UPI0027D7BA9C|nr:hypothetical protein [Arthrobacter globiformis]